jgi:hypothetical protein
MLVSGMSLILGRVLNERRIFVIGFSVVMGLMPALVPGIYANVPDLMRPILESPLAVGTFTAIVLTQFFRIGAAHRKELSVELLTTQNESLREFHVNRSIRDTLVTLGADAGSTRELVDRAVDVTSELTAILKSLHLFDTTVMMAAIFEESRLKIELRYSGLPLPTPDSPSVPESAAHPLALALRLLRGPIDNFSTSSHGREQCLTLVFDA